jgi:hypothetical protein
MMIREEPVDLKTALELLGVSVQATRERVARGSLIAEQDQDGTIYVYLPPDQDNDAQMGSLDDLYQAIIEVKDETISLLERELEMWRKEARRKDHLLATLTDSLPELEPPSPALRESNLTTSGGVSRVTAAQKRQGSLWVRLLG